MSQVRVLLSVQAAAFAAAALVHAGVAASGYEHRQAAVAESVIAIVILLGLIATAAAPSWGRAAALAVQSFALLGTMVGIFVMVIGIGPQSAFDVALHAGFVALLVAGLVAARRAADFSARRA